MSPFAIFNSWFSEMSLGAEFDPGRGPFFEGGVLFGFFVPYSQQKGAVK